jgi:hypothetical protein
VTLIEHLYASLRELGGQQAQLDRAFDTADLAGSFAATFADMESVPAGGSFFPGGSRTPLIELAARRGEFSDHISDTEHLQALLWEPPRWAVVGRPELDFCFVARELTPTSSEATGGRRRWLTADTRRHISLDALLVNADDRTPIVAEIKVGGDQNAELALVQALAAAAQLSAPAQLRRLHREYRDHLGLSAPSRLDVYVITARSPPRGTRPLLARRARERVADLERSGLLARWIRRIVFLDAAWANGTLSLTVIGPDQPVA